MGKIQSREDLADLRNKYRDNVIMRLVSDNAKTRTEVNVAIGDCGYEKGARDTLLAFFNEVNAARLEHVSVIAADCMGDCADEPIVEIVEPGKAPVRFKNVTPARAKEIVASHLAGGKEAANA